MLRAEVAQRRGHADGGRPTPARDRGWACGCPAQPAHGVSAAGAGPRREPRPSRDGRCRSAGCGARGRQRPPPSPRARPQGATACAAVAAAHARVVRVRTADAASARRTAANPSTITAKGLRGSSMTAKPTGIRTPTCNRAKQRNDRASRTTPREWPAPPGPRRPRVGLGRGRPACPHIQRSRRFLDGCRKPRTGDHDGSGASSQHDVLWTEGPPAGRGPR